MSNTMNMLVDRLRERGFVLKQVGRSGMWVLYTRDGLIDLGPTPSTRYEWERLLRRLRFAGVDLPADGEEE